jgi:hypothetical protein
MKGRLLGLAALSALMLSFSVSAQADPADRVGVSAGVVEAFECSAADPGASIPCVDIDGPPNIADGVAATILGPFEYKSNTSADLIFQLATECTLFNYVKRNSDQGGTWSTSEASVTMWIEVASQANFSDAIVVKVSDDAAVGTAAVPNGMVKMCSRSVALSLTETSAIDGTLQAELAIASMAAHAFNWVMKNPAAQLGTNVYHIRVRAVVDLDDTNQAVSGAGFRQRTLIVNSVHLANNESF